MMPNQRPNWPPRQNGEGREDLQNTEDQGDPAPGVQVAEDVLLIVDEELRVADRRDPVDHVQPADDHHYDPANTSQPGPDSS
jgi:hypothetical protein